MTAEPTPPNACNASCANPGCGKPFRASRHWQRFCSASCRSAFHTRGSVSRKEFDALMKRVAALEAKA